MLLVDLLLVLPAGAREQPETENPREVACRRRNPQQSGADQQPMATPETPAAYASARFTRTAAELFDAGTTLH